MFNGMKRFWLGGALIAVALLGGCTSRYAPTVSSDHGSAADSAAPILDASGPSGPDACRRPPGGCFSDKECPAGQTCKGCGVDPCCPGCTVCYGACASGPPPVPCTGNPDCPKDSYCHIDGACKITGGKMGQCRVRPTGCGSTYNPVCGCDGSSWNSLCSAYAAGVNPAHNGACAADCAALEKPYKEALIAAYKCHSPTATGCSVSVANKLTCGCPTFINVYAKQDQATMAGLHQQYKSMKCALSFPCPKNPCPKVALSGTCAGDFTTTKWNCRDNFAP